MPNWTFLSNHGQVLLCTAHDPGVRLREIGDQVGITERAAHRIVGSWSTPATSCASAGAGATTTPSPPTALSPTHSHATAESAIS
jgi:hypothetical protein